MPWIVAPVQRERLLLSLLYDLDHSMSGCASVIM